ncbi:MAG: hypothetical protein MUC63_01090, partial [Planctomycetes bacterium]|nr:hypothetical protein [Planctomycetota bacterium]
ELHRRVAAAPDAAALAAVRAELADRFGPPPPEAEALLALARFKIAAAAAGAVYVGSGQGAVFAVFEPAGSAKAFAAASGGAAVEYQDGYVRIGVPEARSKDAALLAFLTPLFEGASARGAPAAGPGGTMEP